MDAAVGHPPRFDGIFVALNPATSVWNETMWTRDINAMKAVNMSFFVLPHLVHQTGQPTAACDSGSFDVYFPLQGSGIPTACFKEAGLDSATHEGGTVGAILSAANATELTVHLGLAVEKDMDAAMQSQNATKIRTFASLQWQVAQQLWRLASAAGLSHTVSGFYTEVEESK